MHRRTDVLYIIVNTYILRIINNYVHEKRSVQRNSLGVTNSPPWHTMEKNDRLLF